MDFPACLIWCLILQVMLIDEGGSAPPRAGSRSEIYVSPFSQGVLGFVELSPVVVEGAAPLQTTRVRPSLFHLCGERMM